MRDIKDVLSEAGMELLKVASLVHHNHILTDFIDEQAIKKLSDELTSHMREMYKQQK